MQSHAVNLLVTGLAARLALIPHPALHEFLLDPFLSIVPGVHTLFTTLTKVGPSYRLFVSISLCLSSITLLGTHPLHHSDQGWSLLQDLCLHFHLCLFVCLSVCLPLHS